MQYDEAKLKALVHYIVWCAGDRPGFGATKLNKILWFSDARLYMLRGEPITGAVYIREKFGPIPHQMMNVRAALEQEGKIRISNGRFYNRSITHFHALDEPGPIPISQEELKTVDWWIEHIAEDHTANSISEKSHDYGWELYDLGQIIPYRAFLASRVREEMRPEDRTWAERRAKELGLP